MFALMAYTVVWRKIWLHHTSNRITHSPRSLSSCSSQLLLARVYFFFLLQPITISITNRTNSSVIIIILNMCVRERERRCRSLIAQCFLCDIKHGGNGIKNRHISIIALCCRARTHVIIIYTKWLLYKSPEMFQTVGKRDTRRLPPISITNVHINRTKTSRNDWAFSYLLRPRKRKIVLEKCAPLRMNFP